MIPGLTGLRGVAALWVVLLHMAGGESHILFVRNGALGVDVFFILSGFVLSYVYADKLTPVDFNGYRTFLRARLARIYPLHVFMLALIGLSVLVLPGFASGHPQTGQRFSFGAFIASLLLIQNWFYWLPTCWNAPAWSLSAEWFAYITFPITICLTQRWRTVALPLFLTAALLAALIAALIWRGVQDTDVTGTPGMVRMLFEFASGCLLFRAVANGLKPLPKLADAGAVSMLLVSLLWQDVIFLALPAIALIILSAAQNEGPIARALSMRPVVILGEISFSLYMVHWMILNVANWMIRNLELNSAETAILNATLLLTVIGTSVLSYRLIELPARSWGRSIIRKSRPLNSMGEA
jgi:peptidoglycan/LPS O-acetylase OafA/YrhL